MFTKCVNAFDRNFIFAQNCNRHYQLSAYLHGRALQVYVAPHHLWHIDLTQTLNHKQYKCISRLTYIQSQINWSTMFMWFWDQLTLTIRKKTTNAEYALIMRVFQTVYYKIKMHIKCERRKTLLKWTVQVS